MKTIPLDELKVGHVYRLHARNLRYGVWNGVTFVGLRTKFGSTFLDECEVPGHTAFALEDVGTVPEGTPLSSSLGSVDRNTMRPIAFDESIRAANNDWGWYFTDTGETDPGRTIRSMATSNPKLYEFMKRFE